MAWVKVPAENHPIFYAALPRDLGVTTLKMFGGVAAMVNGNLFGGLFGRSAIVKLSPEDQPEALALDGAEPFDPMGTGRVMTNTVFLPDAIMDEPNELRDWLARAFRYAATLPPKAKKEKAAKAKPGVKPAKAAKAKPAVKPAKAAKAKPAAKRVKTKPATAKPASARTKVAARGRGAKRPPARTSRR